MTRLLAIGGSGFMASLVAKRHFRHGYLTLQGAV